MSPSDPTLCCGPCDLCIHDILKDIKRGEQLADWCSTLETAMEHAAHGFGDMERQGRIQWQMPMTWPPQVLNPVGSDVYHFAAMAMYVQRIYAAMIQERNRGLRLLQTGDNSS